MRSGYLKRTGGRFIPQSDANFSSVVLLAHMDGSDSSTSFIDSSSSAKTITANGNARLSTSSVKFGTACAFFDGVGDYLSIANSVDFDFGSGNFTIEGWFRRASLPVVVYGLVSKRSSTANFAPFNLEMNNTGALTAQISTTGSSFETISGSIGLMLNTYHHVAIVRDGSTFRMFIDGVADGTASVSGSLMVNTVPVIISAASSSPEFEFDGRIDDLRITKGVARYTSNFTPPSTAFPDF